jgi:hypothetical protein
VSGDAAFNVIASVNSVAFTRSYAVNTDPDKQTFLADVQLTFQRYDNFAGSHMPPDSVPFTLGFVLRSVNSGTAIPLEATNANSALSIFKYDPPPPDDPTVPRVINTSRTLVLQPQEAVQLDSVNDTYRLEVTVAHTENLTGPVIVTGNTASTPAERLLHFNGTLFFGPVETTFTSIDNDPFTASVVAGSHVNTQLGVDNASGELVNHPGYTYGNGADLLVRLRANGNAELSAGSTPLNVPADNAEKLANVKVERVAPATLSTLGVRSSIQVTLPAGFGYRFDTNGHFLNSKLTFNNVLLDVSLHPSGVLTYSPVGGLFAVEETKPLWIEASAMSWDVSAGQFALTTPGVGGAHYVRHDEYAALAAAPPLDNSDGPLKRSNDRYFESVAGISAAVEVRADANCAAQASFSATFGSGDFRAHFPYDARIQWGAAGGSLFVTNDNVVTNDGRLLAVNPVAVPYARDCEADCGMGAGTDSPSVVPAGGELRFTRDGGLAGGGPLSANKRLQWGYIESLADYAHEAFTFSAGDFHMPGVFLRGDQVGLAMEQRAAAVLFTGVAVTNLGYLERPDKPGTLNQQRYELGFADYAGINFRVLTDSAKQAESILAGEPTGTYQLKGISKYYVRHGGVSGIHDSVPGTFPAMMTLYGYAFQFSNFGLNFLDSEMHDPSLIDGSLEVPFPSDFVQGFESLRINCLGGLEDAKVANPGDVKPLSYWNGSFASLAMEFRRDPPSICNVSNAYLVLGVETAVAHVSETLSGRLGFLPDGNLISRAVGLEGIDSRLKLPNVIRFKGPADERYTLTPVADVYFNHHPKAAGEPAGWVNIAGLVDVPFFEDMKVHLHTSASTNNPDALIYLMGGWPSEGFTDNDADTFFDDPAFDDANVGFPASGSGFPNPVSVADYRNNPGDRYHPRAQRTWLGVIPFDYPLDWSPTLRTFRSTQPKENNLLVLQVENELKYLSAEHAEITFGAQYDGLPVANLVSLAFNAIDQATGVSTALENAIGGVARDQIETGLERMDRILADDQRELFGNVFTNALDPVIDDLYDAMQDSYDLDPGDFEATQAALLIEGYFRGTGAQQPANNHAAYKFENLVKGDGSDTPAAVLNEIDDYLQRIETAITKITEIVEEGGDSQRMIAAVLIEELVGQFAAEVLGPTIDQYLNELLVNADPTLDQITIVLNELKTVLMTLRGALNDPAGMGTELADRFASAAGLSDISELTTTASSAVTGFFADIDYDLDSPFEDYSPAEIKGMLRRELEDAYFGTALAAGAQSILKQRAYDTDAAIREATDTVFQQINDILRDLLSQTLANLDTSFGKALGDLASKLGAASINGYAHINGDSLKELRLDLKAKFDIGGEMQFNAFFRIRELDSSETPGCDYGGDTVTEVTLGATDIKCDWISPDLLINVSTKFTFDSFDDGFQGFPLRGLAGAFEIQGGINFQAFELTYLGAAVAFGQEENYISAAVGLRFNKVEAFGGIYFGRTCTLDPIQLWDPVVADVLGTPPFTGIYAYGEAWIPINEAIGIPSTCLFNIQAGVGTGFGMFLEGPTFVAKMKAGVSGEVLCLISIRGEIVMVGVISGGDIALKGQGTFSAEIGPCPICISLSKTIGMTFKNNKWKIDK